MLNFKSSFETVDGIWQLCPNIHSSGGEYPNPDLESDPLVSTKAFEFIGEKGVDEVRTILQTISKIRQQIQGVDTIGFRQYFILNPDLHPLENEPNKNRRILYTDNIINEHSISNFFNRKEVLVCSPYGKSCPSCYSFDDKDFSFYADKFLKKNTFEFPSSKIEWELCIHLASEFLNKDEVLADKNGADFMWYIEDYYAIMKNSYQEISKIMRSKHQSDFQR